jgi:hypothetical protein
MVKKTNSGRKKARSRKRKSVRLLRVSKSPKSSKKYRAVFSVNGREKNVDFGAAGYQNYGGVGSERHLDEERKRRYIARHKSRENWKDPTSPGALSRFILWNKPTFKASLADYRRRFDL